MKLDAYKFSAVGVITVLIATFGFSPISSSKVNPSSTSEPISLHSYPSQSANIAPQIAKGFAPPNRGAPASTTDGGTRGCPVAKAGPGGQVPKPLTALTLSQHLPLTVNDYPTFLWYVPSPAIENVNLQFALFEFDEIAQQDAAEAIYTATIPIPAQGGIVRLKLPEEEQYQLRQGQIYHWYVEMACDPDDPIELTFSEGFIERVALSELRSDLASRLREVDPDNPLALSAIYAEAGIWHEALAYLAQQRWKTPDNREVAKRWADLLDSVQLGDFAEEQILN